MADDKQRVIREEETVVSGTPQTPYTTPVAGVASTTPGERVVSHNVSQSMVDPAAERAANVNWFGRVIWFIDGLLTVLLAIRFVLLSTGANGAAGFTRFIYGFTGPFVAPFLGIFGQHMTYPGSANTGIFEPEILLAIVVYALIAWAIVKIAEIALGTNRTHGTTITDVNRHARV